MGCQAQIGQDITWSYRFFWTTTYVFHVFQRPAWEVWAQVSPGGPAWSLLTQQGPIDNLQGCEIGQDWGATDEWVEQRFSLYNVKEDK